MSNCFSFLSSHQTQGHRKGTVMALDKQVLASRDRARRHILLSVWAVVLFGLPLWWKATRVYRAELPYNDIAQWNDWKTCKPSFPIKVNLHLSKIAPISTQEDEHQILSGIKDTVSTGIAGLVGIPERPIHLDINQSWSGSKERDILNRASVIPGTYDFYISPGANTSATIRSQRQGFIQLQTWNKEHISNSVIETLNAIFSEEEGTIRQLFLTLNGQGSEKTKGHLKAVKYAPGYQLTFSLFSGDASNGVREWKIQEAINAFFAPFLKSMSVISTFTVESQVQHYASLTFVPQFDADRKEHYLTPDTLPNFINAAEWSLASTVSSLPPLNFLAYVPKPSESPLVIRSESSGSRSLTNSFLIPRWGGITILNREHGNTSSTPHVITVQELEPPMKIFLTQLRDLMGVSDLSFSKASFPIVFHKTVNGALTTWELDSLLRRRTAENLVDSLATIASLARLVMDTPNMVVLDHIQKDVINALKDVERSCQRLSEQDYLEAISASRDALVKSETAFFDPTMVSMLYFPDEHKYAIYMPLFVPISVPLVMAVLRELKRWKENKRNTSDETSKTKVD